MSRHGAAYQEKANCAGVCAIWSNWQWTVHSSSTLFWYNLYELILSVSKVVIKQERLAMIPIFISSWVLVHAHLAKTKLTLQDVPSCLQFAVCSLQLDKQDASFGNGSFAYHTNCNNWKELIFTFIVHKTIHKRFRFKHYYNKVLGRSGRPPNKIWAVIGPHLM